MILLVFRISGFLDGVLRRAVQRDRLPDTTDAVLISRPVGARPTPLMRIKSRFNLPVSSHSPCLPLYRPA